MWETICDAWACWSGWNFGPNSTEYPLFCSTEYAPPPRKWQFSWVRKSGAQNTPLPKWKTWKPYVETKAVLPGGYHLVINILDKHANRNYCLNSLNQYYIYERIHVEKKLGNSSPEVVILIRYLADNGWETPTRNMCIIYGLLRIASGLYCGTKPEKYIKKKTHQILTSSTETIQVGIIQDGFSNQKLLILILILSLKI